MTIVVLLILAAVWAAVLIPPALRARAEGSPADSIGSFRHQLSVLRRTGTGEPLAPAPFAPAHRLAPVAPEAVLQARRVPVQPVSRSRATVKRRRDIFSGLLVGTAGSLVLGLLPPLRVMWGLSLVLGLLLAGYVALLVQLRNVAAEREMKVRFLPPPAPTPEPAFALAARRSAN